MKYPLDVVGVVALGAVRVWDRSDPKVAGDAGHVGRDEHIVPLSRPDTEYVSVIRLDGDKVAAYYLERMVVDHKIEMGTCGAVDQAEQVNIALRDRGVET